MQQAAPDAVAHFAALAYVGESVTQPAEYYRVNTMGVLNVLTAMRAAHVGQMVFSSTCATYGVPLQTPIDENHPQRPINPYGWSKLFVEQMLADHDAAYGMRHVALRCFNAAGADPDGEIGERHQPETHVIPLAIRGAQCPDYSFTILGTAYETRDGTAVRDYIHVADLADAHLRALTYLCAGGASDVFNLGTGSGTTVQEVANAVAAASGRPLPRAAGPRRAGDPAALVANSAKAARILGWKPAQSDIQTIISDAWRWHQADARTLFGFDEMT